jgi:hypothetical protein
MSISVVVGAVVDPGLAVTVTIARIDTIAVLIDPVAEDFESNRGDAWLRRRTVGLVRIAIAVRVGLAFVLAVAVFVEPVARDFVPAWPPPRVMIVAVDLDREAISVLVSGARVGAANGSTDQTVGSNLVYRLSIAVPTVTLFQR